MSFSATSILQCPSCARVISYANEQTNITICPSCWSPLLRQRDNTVIAKPLPVILKKNDFIQPGTTGIYKGNAFTVLGRCRTWFEEAVFNYWTIEWTDKKIALLAEGYGLFAILKPTQLTALINYTKLEKVKTGTFVELNDSEKFVLEKKQKTINWEIEGELLLADVSSQFTVYDFSFSKEKKITIIHFQKDNFFAYDADYVTGTSLQLKNKRNVTPEDKSFTCTQCNKPVIVKAFPFSQSCACRSCGTHYSFNNGVDFKKAGNLGTDEVPCMELGATGKIDDIPYEVVGYTQKEEQNIYHSKWREYTLYNVEEGFAFLSEYDGHWTFLRETCNSPVAKDDHQKDLYVDNTNFQLFNAYTYQVVNARGEFPYNVFDNNKTRCREFIAPPFIWIQEKDEKEGIRWFSGRHIAAKEVAAVFNAITPYKTGIGAVQPGSVRLEHLMKATLIGFAVLLFTYFISTMGKQEKQLFSNTFYFSDTSNTVSFVTEKYELTKRSSNIKLSISADVSNSWFELGATLVNATTGKEYTVEKGVEYYYGYSDSESWTEGSRQGNAYFTRIPAGTYFLQLQGTRDGAGYRIRDFSVDITYDVTNDRNLWISVLLFLLWPVGKYLHMRHVETERWRNSPYSTYNNED